MITLASKPRIDGQVRSCKLSHNRKIYFIRSDRRVLATIYDVGATGAGMWIIGSKRREFVVMEHS